MNELHEKGKGIKKRAIIALVLYFTLILSIVGLVLQVINIVQILTTDWRNEELNNSKTLWGILSIFLLGPIASIVFGSKVDNVLSGVPNVTQEVPATEEQPAEAATA